MEPRIVSLVLDEGSTARLDALRTQHFPPERLVVGAHLTLFHALPPEAPVEEELARVAARAPFALRVTGVQRLGRGVAYALRAPELDALHADLQRAWRPWLTRQDRQGLRPHVTVQNKVEPERARALHARLSAEFVPWTARAEGLALWAYRGGPWEPLARYAFPDAVW